MRRLIFGILSACLFVASLVLCVGSLHKPLVLTYHGFGGTVVYSFDGALCLASAHNFSASSVGRFGYPTESTNTIKLLNLWIVALFATLAFGLSLWYQRNPKRGHCTHCGYNLAGNTSGICPEYGMRIPTAVSMNGHVLV